MKRNYCLSLVLLALLGMSVPYSVVAADNALSSQSTQQAKTITGKVVDVAGEPIIGASVLVKGSSTGSVTDIDGKFSVEAPVGSTLVVSFVGYATEEVKVGAASDYTVTLKDDTQSLSEVVVTAMGIKKEKKALGYSVSDINSKELMKNKQTNVVNSLAGKIPGVNITQAGGAAGAGSNIVIRGGNSASESRDNQPLFVVDGIIYDNSTVNTGNSGTDGMTKTATTFSNRVMDINPEDIESMSVLKGAAAAALYGSRAANGVIIITTKKGEEGAVRVNVSSKYTYSWANKLPEVQKLYGRGEYNTSGAFIDKTMDSWGDRIDGMAYDNIDDFFQGSSVWDNSVSVSGGSKNGSFYLSGSNYHQSGIIPTTGYDKTTFRFNGEQKYGILTVGANVSYSQASTDKTLTSAGLYGQGGNGAMTAVYGWPVDDQMSRYLNDDGSKYRILEGLQDLEDDVENPYWILNKNTLTDETSRFTGAVNASLKLTDWWDVSARAGIDKYTTSSNTLRRPGGAVKQIYQNGYMSKGDVNYQYITTNVMSNFHKTFGDFDLNLLVGTTTEATKTTNNTRWGYNFVTEGLYSFNNIIKANQYFKESTVRKRMVGLYGEFRASYKNLVYLTVTGRNDWSSTLPVNNRSYFYPSVSGSFVFTELLPKNNVLSFGKIRGSWARVGKDADAYSLGYYMWPVATLNGGKYGMGNSWTGGSVGLKPEIQDSYELGLDYGFFKNNRISGTLEFYKKKTKDLLYRYTLSPGIGLPSANVNFAAIENRGIDFDINAKIINTRNLSWSFSFNISKNLNKVTGLDSKYVSSPGSSALNNTVIEEGKSVGLFYGYKSDGIFQNWEEIEACEALNPDMPYQQKFSSDVLSPGDIKLLDLSNDGYVNFTANNYEDKTVLGSSLPDFSGGFSTRLTYKGFTFSMSGTFSYGNMKSWDAEGRQFQFNAARPKNLLDIALKRWTPENPTNDYPKIRLNGTNYGMTDFWLHDASYLKINNISLTYQLPANWLRRTGFIDRAELFGSITNVYTFTSYPGPNPESFNRNDKIAGAAVDYTAYPQTRTYNIGIKLSVK